MTTRRISIPMAMPTRNAIRIQMQWKPRFGVGGAGGGDAGPFLLYAEGLLPTGSRSQ
jgi:hypothetical protein